MPLANSEIDRLADALAERLRLMTPPLGWPDVGSISEPEFAATGFRRGSGKKLADCHHGVRTLVQMYGSDAVWQEGLRVLKYPPSWNREGIWATGEEGALDPRDIEAAIVLPGPASGYFLEWEPYIAGFDMAISRDHAALVVVASEEVGSYADDNHYKLVHCDSWKPPGHGVQIPVEVVRRECIEVIQKYNVSGFIYDPAQGGSMMAQDVHRATGVATCAMPFVPRNLDLMAKTMLEVFSSRKIDIYNHSELISDLHRLQVVDRVVGYKLDPPKSDARGHCDRGIALSIALPYAVAWAAQCRQQRNIPEEIVTLW